MMNKYKTAILFLVAIFIIAALDRAIYRYWDYLYGWFVFFANFLLKEDSIFFNDFFASSLLRFFLSISTFFAFCLMLFAIRVARPSFQQLLPNPIVALVLTCIFVYLNSMSENSDHLIYALLSFLSILALTAREHIIFGVQYYFSKSILAFWITSAIGLIVFVISHERAFSFESTIGNIFIVNLWIYSTRARSLWLAVTMHVAWNLILPGSTEFIVFMLALSFYLAFAPGTCPAVFIPIRDFKDRIRVLRILWLPFDFILRVVHAPVMIAIQKTRISQFGKMRE